MWNDRKDLENKDQTRWRNGLDIIGWKVEPLRPQHGEDHAPNTTFFTCWHPSTLCITYIYEKQKANLLCGIYSFKPNR